MALGKACIDDIPQRDAASRGRDGRWPTQRIDWDLLYFESSRMASAGIESGFRVSVRMIFSTGYVCALAMISAVCAARSFGLDMMTSKVMSSRLIYAAEFSTPILPELQRSGSLPV